MKVLYISGDDYAALAFEKKYSGTLVSEIIENTDKFEADENDDNYWELEVTELEGNDISKSFIKYVKDKIDYDNSKNEMWYHESETI